MNAPLTRMGPHWRKGLELLHEFRYEVAQLDLLASRAVQSALVERARVDPGLGLRVPPGSLLGQMLARRHR